MNFSTIEQEGIMSLGYKHSLQQSSTRVAITYINRRLSILCRLSLTMKQN